jgi:GNAT superfamily N-acetyltransferase
MRPRQTGEQRTANASELRIRPAVVGDAFAIAGLHIRAWQWAYRGLIPDEFLEDLPGHLDRRTRNWAQSIERPAPSDRIWVAEHGAAVVGLASTGLSRDEDAAATTAEVYAVYLEPEVVGTGMGRRLFAHAVDDLRFRSYAAATLWVLEGNHRARRFYEAAGWRADGATKVEERAGFELHEMRYRIGL